MMGHKIHLRGGLLSQEDGKFVRGSIIIDGAYIEAVKIGTAADEVVEAAEVIDCSNCLLTPGMVNAHYHSNENWFRGCWDNLPLELWSLFAYPKARCPAQSPDEIYVRTLLGGIELLHTGATSVIDFLYEPAGFTEESVGAVVRAYRDLGIRAVIAIGMSDLVFTDTVVLEPTLVPKEVHETLRASQVPSWDDWRSLCRAMVSKYHNPTEGIAIGLAPSGPQRCSDEMLVGCRELADELDLTIHSHVLETRMQALSGELAHGCTLPQHLAEIGFMSERVSFEHGVWLTPSDIDLVAEHGVTIVHNPAANLKLGSGLCPVPSLLQRGVNVALGTDGPASNDGSDMFATVKLAALIHRLWTSDYLDWPSAAQVWNMATSGGARAAGQADRLGRLAPGAYADIVLMDLESRAFSPLNDVQDQIVFCSAADAVRSVMVGGRWRLLDRRVLGVNESEILALGRELAPSVVARHADAFRFGRELFPAVAEGWKRAQSFDIGSQRKIALEAYGGARC